MPRPLELELFHGVMEGGGKIGEHMAGEVMRAAHGPGPVEGDAGRRHTMAAIGSG
jgi:hypothetical protein